MRTPTSNSSKSAQRARDAGLRKVSVATRALVVASVAAAGAFAALAAWAQPGRSKVVRTAAPNATATIPATTPVTNPRPAESDDEGGDDYLAPPVTAPAAPAPGYQYTAPSYQAPAPAVVSRPS